MRTELFGIEASNAVSGLREAATLLAFRLVPVAGYVVLARKTPLGARFLVATLCGAAAFGVESFRLFPIGAVCAGYAYLVVAACVVPTLARRLRCGVWTRGAVLACSLVLFLGVPTIAWPPIMKLSAMVVSWDLVLSSYSYAIDVSEQDRDPPLAECLFFLLVNPALVYARRGRRLGDARPDARGMRRIAVGLALSFGATAVLLPGYHAVRRSLPAATTNEATIAVLVGCGILRFVVEYARHSALASIQIGLLRQLGWQIPERYVWPILSTSMQDFWRRWNTYVGQWAFRYVFSPFVRRFARPSATPYARAATMVGVIVTFVIVGVLHDAYLYAKEFVVQPRMTMLFAYSGVAVVLSVAGERLLELFRDRALVPTATWSSATAAALSRVALWALLIGGALRWLI